MMCRFVKNRVTAVFTHTHSYKMVLFRIYIVNAIQISINVIVQWIYNNNNNNSQ